MKNHRACGYFYVFILSIFLLLGQSIKTLPSTSSQLNTDGTALSFKELGVKFDHKHTVTLVAEDIPALDASKITKGTFGTAQIADGAVTTAKVADSTINTSKITDLAVTNSKINDVAASKITGTIAVAQIANSAVTNAKIANSALTNSKINDVAATKITGTLVTSQIPNLDVSKITTGAFGTTQIADGAITTAKIADGSVTNDKIISIDGSKILGAIDSSIISNLLINNIEGLSNQLLFIVQNGANFLVDSASIFINPFTYFKPGSCLKWADNNNFKAQWQGVFPAECSIDMKGNGILELNSDFVLKGDGHFYTLGTIRSNERVLDQANIAMRSLDLSKYQMMFPRNSSQQGVLENIILNLHGDIVLNTTLTINENVIINGNGHKITFSDYGKIAVTAGSIMHLKNVTLDKVQSVVEKVENRKFYSIITGIDLQETVDSHSALILEKSIIIPKEKKSFFNKGHIKFMDSYSRLGTEGKILDVFHEHVDLEFDVKAFSGKIPILACTNFGNIFTMNGDIDFRGGGFSNAAKVDFGGNTMLFNCRTYPSTTNLFIDFSTNTPIPQVPLGLDSVNFSIDKIITTEDVKLPIIGLLHKGLNDTAKLVFGIVNPYTKNFVKGVELDFNNASSLQKIIDFKFLKTQPLEVVEDGNYYDRYYVLVLYGGNDFDINGIQIYQLDINQDFYKKDIFDPKNAADYNKIGQKNESDINRLGRMSLNSFNDTASGILKTNLTSFVKFDKAYKSHGLAIHPNGKEFTVIVENSDDNSYELRNYQVFDTGKIVNTIDKIIRFSRGVNRPFSSKGNCLQWTIDGKFLLLSTIENDKGVIQVFFKDEKFEKIMEYYLPYSALFSLHPYDETLIIIAHDKFFDGDFMHYGGIEMSKIDNLGFIKRIENTYTSMIEPTIFNSIEWHPDGNLLVNSTENGLVFIPYSHAHGTYEVEHDEFYSELNSGCSIKSAKFLPSGDQLISDGFVLNSSLLNKSVLLYTFENKGYGAFGNGFLKLTNHLGFIVPVDITHSLEIDLNKNRIEIPSTGNLKIGPGVSLTLKNGELSGLKTFRRAFTQDKMINELAGITFADSTSMLVLDSCNIKISGNVDCVAPGNIEIKTDNSIIYFGGLRILDEGATKIISTEGYSFVADKISNSVLFLGSKNNLIDQSKLTISNTNIEQAIRKESILSLSAFQVLTEGQQQKNLFERSSNGSRTPLYINGSDDVDKPVRYPLQQYMELLGSGPGDIIISGYVHVEGPETIKNLVQSSIVDNTIIKVENGARLIIKSGSILTCTGKMSLIAGVNGIIIIEDDAVLQFGSKNTSTVDELNLVGDGGEIELQGLKSIINFAYGKNKITMNNRSSIDTTLGGQILINMDLDLRPTIGSSLVEFTLNKIKIVGSSETNIPVFIIAPNDETAGIESTTFLTIKNIQCTGNTNMQFMDANGSGGIFAVLNGLDQKQSIGAAQLVERLTLVTLPKNNQPINPIRVDANGDFKAASSIDPLFSYTIYNTDRSIQRSTEFTGQEIVTGTDQFGHAFSQFYGETRANT